KISTTGSEIASFTETIFEETLTNEASQWQQRDIDLSEFANQTVYLAIVHNQSTNQFALKIDDFIVHTTPQTKDIELNTYAVYRISENGESQLIKVTEPAVTEITDTVTLEGYYTYAIEAQYNDNESSNATQTNKVMYIDWLPAPENFQATRSGNLVELNWEPASNHNKTLISDGFEAPTNLSQWVNLDFDSDQASWEIHTATGAYEGSQSIASYSWLNGEVLTPNNWLISPNIPVRYAETLNLSWAVAGINTSHSNEYYQIRTATQNSDTTLFAIGLDETIPENDATWKERTLNLNQYIGDTVSVALVHQRSTDVFGLKLDNVMLATTNSIEGYKLYRKLLPDGNLELVEQLSGSSTSFTDTLQSEGNYSYLLAAVYNSGGEGNKAETEPIYYNTIEELPTNIVKIYPNPAKAHKSITITAENQILELKVVNSRGITVKNSNNLHTTQVQLHTTLEAGLYFVKCTTKNGTSTTKLMIE
ncbi:MAG TPA: choice-of-anchor J domain-containing protein, partial [Prolixibacteraceae bacterium]|nr:choice-of-anchor J domain-containing protein [Prolixibacteraceae bacterium]